MIRLNIVVEGHAEETFANHVLRGHLATHGILVAARRVSHVRKGHIRGKGGLRRYRDLEKDLRLWTIEDNTSDARFTTMVDLYAYPNDSPNFDRARDLEPYSRVTLLEAGMRESINDRRFIPYIQLYEFETMLLVDRTAWDRYYLDYAGELASLFGEINSFTSVELINDGPSTAPSKRILRHIPTYDKVTAGSLIALELGLDRIRRACRHFDEWLTTLETLGHNERQHS